MAQKITEAISDFYTPTKYLTQNKLWVGIV